MSHEVGSPHPLVEAVAKKLFGIANVPPKEAHRMAQRAIKVVAEYTEKTQFLTYVCYSISFYADHSNPDPDGNHRVTVLMSPDTLEKFKNALRASKGEQ
jgi:hypothetical protein